jgi:hypothetical protein
MVQKIREGYTNLRNNTRIPLKNQVYFANEFAEDITPKILNKNNNNQ